ncbi:Isoprene synthase, chloroplastic, partial [Mucuna pruriens]
MASDLLSLPYCLSSTQILSRSHIHLRHIITPSNAKFLNGSSRKLICVASKQDSQYTQNQNRRSANYQPNLWTDEFIQSLRNHPQLEKLQERATKLEEKVRLMINNTTDMEPLSLLELIDDVERLGLAYKFDEDIDRALERIVSIENFKDQTQKSLHETALYFRILRQQGFPVSQDVFERFRDEKGKFKVETSNNVQGMLSLYEASQLTLEGESLWEANAFSKTHLMNLMKEGMKVEVANQVRHVLEGLPYHQSFHKLEARQYIDTYNKKEPHHRLLLELAKLDFNIVQSSHIKDLQEVSRWWMNIGLASKLNFARDRLMESFFWSVGMVPEPPFAYCRKELTKVVQLITIIDDVYDVYGTLDELELFTDIVERWDVNAINTLPDYLISCFLALYNTVNEMAYDIFKERDIKCLPYFKKAWSDLCKSYLQEAKWFYNKVIPPFNVYLENARISCSGGVFLFHSYFLVNQNQDITEQALHSLTNYHDLLRSSCTIYRLSNDLGTSMDEIKRGETSNSIISYLNETNLSEENARQYYKILIDKEWQNLNKYLVMDSTFSKSFIQVAINLVRIVQCVYQYGDGFGRPDNVSKSRIKSLLIDPIDVDVI